MPENPQSSRDILAEVMDQGRKSLVPHIAEMLKRTGIREVDAAETRRRFWQRALTPEQEANLWAQEMLRRGITELVPGSPEAVDIGLGISKAVYPDRWDMSMAEGRTHESEIGEWAWSQAQKGPPTPKAEEQQLLPPTESDVGGEGY